MKRKLWQVVGFLAALLAASTAAAQSNAGGILADIPFAFTVGSRTLPPGRYTVSRLNDKILRICNSKNGTFAVNNKVEGKAPDSSKMVFHRYGNAYFLSEVWVAGSRTGRELLRSEAEEEWASKRTEMEIAELQIPR
jgi:hypothetical protein